MLEAELVLVSKQLKAKLPYLSTNFICTKDSVVLHVEYSHLQPRLTS